MPEISVQIRKYHFLRRGSSSRSRWTCRKTLRRLGECFAVSHCAGPQSLGIFRFRDHRIAIPPRMAGESRLDLPYVGSRTHSELGRPALSHMCGAESPWTRSSPASPSPLRGSNPRPYGLNPLQSRSCSCQVWEVCLNTFENR